MSERPLRSLFDTYRRAGAWEEQSRGLKFDEWCAQAEANIIAAVLRESTAIDLLRRLVREYDAARENAAYDSRVYGEVLSAVAESARPLLATIDGAPAHADSEA